MPEKFLLEIGTEEIPDWMIPPALAELRKLFEKLLEDNELTGKVTSVDASPRHLVLRAEGLPDKQADKDELLTGPPAKAGEKAAGGFAKKQGVPVEELQTIETEKGEYFALRKQVVGRRTLDILAGESAATDPQGSTGRNRCTGPVRKARASSVRSAGWSRCSGVR